MLNFGDTLKKIRTQKKLTQTKLCSLVGISASYLSQIEKSRKHPPNGDVINKLATALKLDESQRDDLIQLAAIQLGLEVDEILLPVEAKELILEIKKQGDKIPPKFFKGLTSKLREIKG